MLLISIFAMSISSPLSSRRVGAKVLLAATLCVLCSAALADNWPSRPIRFVVPFGPGGANDLVARAVADGVSRQLGQPVVVENKPGAGSVLGADVVAKAAPDGYTFLTPAAGIITNAMIKAHMPFKESDLVPVAMMAVSPSVIVVPADSPIKDLKGLVAASKTAKGLNFSTAGTGSTPHFVAEMLKHQSGARLEVIPYKSGSDGVVAVIGKQVDATSEASVVVLPQIKGGKLKALAVTSPTRLAALPQVPTAVEAGLKGFNLDSWFALYAPKDTPPQVQQRFNDALRLVMKTEAFKAAQIASGIQVVQDERATLAGHKAFLSKETARWRPIIKAAGVYAD